MDKTFVTKDSGERQEFNTGSVRDKPTGKGRFDLIPTEPLRRLAGLYERGATKYGERNWEKGQPLMRYVDSMMRHINCLVAGEPEEDHAAAIAWNAFGYMQTLSRIEAGDLDYALDNRPAPEAQYAGTMHRQDDAPERVGVLLHQIVTESFDPDATVQRVREAIQSEMDRASQPEEVQLEFDFSDEPDEEPFTPAENAWFAGGQAPRDPVARKEVTRCNDPRCQMCPLELEEHPLMRMARRGQGG